MKKLFIIMTLFMSSFFFLSLEKVKAYEYTIELDFSHIEDTLSLKEKLDSYVDMDTTLSDNYIIYLYNGYIRYFLFSDFSLDNFSTNRYSANANSFRFSFNGSGYYGTNLKNITLVSDNSEEFYLTFTNKYMILYQNFDLYLSSDLDSSVTYVYDGFSFTYNPLLGNKVMTLYDLYLEYQNSLNTEEPVHKEELIKVENFYNVIIEKLSYLAETIVSNYIYLSIIAIFMLLFVFKLIFRRFL